MSGRSPALAIVSVGDEPRREIGSVEELNLQPTIGTQGFLVAGPCEDDFAALTPATISRLDSAAITILPLGDDSDLEADWIELPRAIAVRCALPHRQALVAIPDSLLESRSDGDAIFRDVSDPVWEWMIRQADRDCRFGIEKSDVTGCRSPDREARPRLVPDSPPASGRWLLSLLPRFTLADSDKSSKSSPDVVALRAGLLQIHDFLDESHRQSQSIEGAGRHAAGDYWHAIMHRREPDYGNSKYWFRRVGRHPLFVELASRASHVLSACPGGEPWVNRLPGTAGWDPFAFVDLCEASARDEESELARAAREIQWQEMRLLLRHTLADATAAR